MTVGCSPAINYGIGVQVIYKSAIGGTQYSVLNDGALFSSFVVDLADRAQFINSVNNTPFASGSVSVSTLWHGPYVSNATFDDPRPLIATLSQMPRDVQEHEGLTPGMVKGYELVATQGSDLIRLGGLDLGSRPTCEPSCPLTDSAEALGLPGGTMTTLRRAQFGGAELFINGASDGGTAPVVARRSPTGVWSTFTGMTGTPGNWEQTLRTVRFDGTSQLLVDTWTASTQSFTTTDVAATGVTQVGLLATADNLVAAATGPTRQLLIRKRNPSDLSWSTFTPSTTHTLINSLRWEVLGSGLILLGVESNASSALSLVRVDTNGLQTISATAVTGYDVASWGGNVYVVYGLNGDIRFRTIAGSVWSGAGGGPVDFGGPPRTGYTPPYPVSLDANPACEAAYPTMAFVEDALVVTWQERCSPETKWHIVARTVR